MLTEAERLTPSVANPPPPAVAGGLGFNRAAAGEKVHSFARVASVIVPGVFCRLGRIGRVGIGRFACPNGCHVPFTGTGGFRSGEGEEER